MREKSFDYGPLSRGLYIALLWFIPLVVWHYPQWLWHYVSLLIFLGFVLRPLLEWSGIAVWVSERIERIDERLHRRSRDRHRRLIARRERDRKYRHTHRKDPRLPPNW